MQDLEKLAKLVRYYILFCTTHAGSGHPTSSLSATDLMVALFFDKLRFDASNPQNPNNDRVIFSKGHASPLLYSLWTAAGVLSEKELETYRKFGSVLEGHPRPNFKYVDVATGSLGQGLSVGVGMALAMRISGPVNSFLPTSTEVSVGKPASKSSAALPLEAKRSGVGNPSTVATRNSQPKVYVLMGDSETAEGSVWEAISIASYYKLDNLIGIIDVNRLGQSTATMLGHDVDTYKKRVEAFGWDAHVVDGHNFDEILKAYDKALNAKEKPQMIIAKTIKGKGVGFTEDKEGWHGKALSQEQFGEALKELGEVDKSIVGEIKSPVISHQSLGNRTLKTKDWQLTTDYKLGEEVATRKAYGQALAKLGDLDERIVALDAEVSNSTFSEIFREKHPKRYFEMYIAEQNMVGTALGMSKRGKIPFASTFATFFTRAFDQVRMSAYSLGNVKFVGSHAGVSIGEDGPSQMGLEDFAMFRAVFGSVVLCPGDAVACEKLVLEAANFEGLVYIRTNRPATPVIYKSSETFKIGGSKVVRVSKDDKLTIVACGVTLIEAIKAAEDLAGEGIFVRIVDAYSIKPIDEATIRKAVYNTNNLAVTVEDHYFEGGLGDAVLNVFADDAKVKVYKMAVAKMPMSGRGDELLEYEGINAAGIFKIVKILLK